MTLHAISDDRAGGRAVLRLQKRIAETRHPSDEVREALDRIEDTMRELRDLEREYRDWRDTVPDDLEGSPVVRSLDRFFGRVVGRREGLDD